jgi:hypothetical protein
VLDNLPTPRTAWASFYCKLKFEFALTDLFEFALVVLLERIFDVPDRTVTLLLYRFDCLLARQPILDESRNLHGDQHPLDQTQPGGGLFIGCGFKRVADKTKFIVGERLTAMLSADKQPHN